MPSHVISETEANQSLLKILDNVYSRSESYEIKRGKKIIAKIVPATPKKATLKVQDLNQLFKRLPQLETEDQKAFENNIKQIRMGIKI